TLPQRARGVVPDAAVDECPARASVQFVFEQPEVDVIERKRQRHAQPVHAGRDLQGLAGRRRRGVRILEDRFGGHALWMARGGRSRIRKLPAAKGANSRRLWRRPPQTVRKRSAFRRWTSPPKPTASPTSRASST